jgi:hypothetical protein
MNICQQMPATNMVPRAFAERCWIFIQSILSSIPGHIYVLCHFPWLLIFHPQQIRVERPPQQQIKSLYTVATSAVQINGKLHGPIKILCGVQGCPLSMTLYTLSLQPFLPLLQQRLPGLRIGWSHRPNSVVAYADDVTIFLISRNIPIIDDAIRIFEEASRHISTPISQKHSQ